MHLMGSITEGFFIITDYLHDIEDLRSFFKILWTVFCKQNRSKIPNLKLLMGMLMLFMPLSI